MFFYTLFQKVQHLMTINQHKYYDEKEKETTTKIQTNK